MRARLEVITATARHLRANAKAVRSAVTRSEGCSITLSTETEVYHVSLNAAHIRRVIWVPTCCNYSSRPQTLDIRPAAAAVVKDRRFHLDDSMTEQRWDG